MLKPPIFEHSTLVTDDPVLAAKVSSLFTRPGRYFSVLDGPRLQRPDASNEVLRRRNAIVRSGARNVLLGMLPPASVEAMRAGWERTIVSDQYQQHALALRGCIKSPKGTLHWGTDNLGVGLYQARLARQELIVDLDKSPDTSFVPAGTHLLVVCERGDAMAEVIASNLAFSCNASFVTIKELPEDDREAWIEEIYSLGDGGDVTGQFGALCERARSHLKSFDFSSYKTVLFITSEFPWGISIPEIVTSHMYRYPDFGRAVIEGIWASQKPSSSARTALLIDPQAVKSSEVQSINQVLQKNKTLTRFFCGPAASQTRVQFVLDLLPHDIVVLSSHAGDAPGERITYEYHDADGRRRKLVVDQAVGIGYDPSEDTFSVTEYHRFHSLDGVDWRDNAGKAALPVGAAMTSWSALEGPLVRSDYIVSKQPIPRVIGSMAISLYDGVWLYSPQGFSPESAPLFFNNSCWSWHELSKRTTYAGARGYIGTLFPVTNAEAQEVGRKLFGYHVGQPLSRALWLTQQEVYGSSYRRPYVMVGLPFVTIAHNVSDSVSFLERAYRNGIAEWMTKARSSPHEDVRQNARRFSTFLAEDFDDFRRAFPRPKPRRTS